MAGPGLPGLGDILGGGGGGGSAPTTYTTHTDTDGSITGTVGAIYQKSSNGAISIIYRPSTPKEPEPPDAPFPDANNDGYDDRTGLPGGVIRDSNSPSGYYYHGIPVNPDGSPYSAVDKPPKTGPYKAPDGSVWLLDENGNPVRKIFDAPDDTFSAPASGGGSNRPVTLGGGGSAGPVRDYAGEQAADNEFQMAYLAAQQEFQAAQNQLQRDFQSGQQGSSQAFEALQAAEARMQQIKMQALQAGVQVGLQEDQQAFTGQQNANNMLGQWGMQQGAQQFTAGQNSIDRALNVLQTAQAQQMQLYRDAQAGNIDQAQFAAQYRQNNAQIDLARRNAALAGAAQVSKQMSDTDPAAAIAWQAANGNNIANALAGGGDAISSNALAGAGLTLRTMDQALTPLGDYQWTPQDVSAPGQINVDEWLAKINQQGQQPGQGEMPAWLQTIMSQQQSGGGSSGGSTPSWLQSILDQMGNAQVGGLPPASQPSPAVPGSGAGGSSPSPAASPATPETPPAPPPMFNPTTGVQGGPPLDAWGNQPEPQRINQPQQYSAWEETPDGPMVGTPRPDPNGVYTMPNATFKGYDKNGRPIWSASPGAYKNPPKQQQTVPGVAKG